MNTSVKARMSSSRLGQFKAKYSDNSRPAIRTAIQSTAIVGPHAMIEAV
jgi:hypothetical protein